MTEEELEILGVSSLSWTTDLGCNVAVASVAGAFLASSLGVSSVTPQGLVVLVARIIS